MFTLTAQEQATLDGVGVLTTNHVITSTEKTLVDSDLASSLVDSSISLGVPDTSKVKYFALANTGTADITSIKLDGGTIALKLKTGETLILAGAGVAKAFLDAWSTATTALLLKVTTPAPAGSNAAHLKAVVVLDAA